MYTLNRKKTLISLTKKNSMNKKEFKEYILKLISLQEELRIGTNKLTSIKDNIKDEELIDMYIDYANNYSSIKELAEDYSISIEEARELIKKGKREYKISTKQIILQEPSREDDYNAMMSTD